MTERIPHETQFYQFLLGSSSIQPTDPKRAKSYTITAGETARSQDGTLAANEQPNIHTAVSCRKKEYPSPSRWSACVAKFPEITGRCQSSETIFLQHHCLPGSSSILGGEGNRVSQTTFILSTFWALFALADKWSLILGPLILYFLLLLFSSFSSSVTFAAALG